MLFNMNGAVIQAQSAGYLLGSRTIITATGASTYTVPAGCRAFIAEAIGAGGNGANAANSSAGQITLGSGGSGGAYATTLLTATAGGSKYSASVGATAAGTTLSALSGTVLVSAGGGQNGSALATGTSEIFVLGSFSNSSSAMEFKGDACAGGTSHRVSGTVAVNGRGGSGPCGGTPVTKIAQSVGTAGGKYGGGGSGGISVNAGGAATGGAGGQGVLVIWEFY